MIMNKITDRKEYYREYSKRPDVKKKIKEYHREYHKRPDVKEKRKEYLNRPDVKEKRKEYYREYHNRPDVKKRKKEYNNRLDVKEKRKEYYNRPDVKEKRKEYYNRPDVKKKQREYNREYIREHPRKSTERGKQRKTYIRQRDIYMTRLESLVGIIELEKRRQLRRSSLMRARKIETLEQKQANIISKIDEYSEAIEASSIHGMTKDK